MSDPVKPVQTNDLSAARAAYERAVAVVEMTQRACENVDAPPAPREIAAALGAVLRELKVAADAIAAACRAAPQG